MTSYRLFAWIGFAIWSALCFHALYLNSWPALAWSFTCAAAYLFTLRERQ